MTENIVLEADTSPRPENWVETCDILSTATPEEREMGALLGTSIDPDDDTDDGLAVQGMRTLVASDRDAALTKARALKRVMLDYGVPQVDIQLLPGRPNGYGVYDALFVVDEMSHHVVSRYSAANLTPLLALVRNGRSDLPGPLSNGYGGWDLTYRILTFGWANHPGAGGPQTIPAYSGGTFTIPRDSARRYSWGTEWEGGLLRSDWDRVLTNPRNGMRMTMREFMGRSNAALRDYHKMVHHNEHSSWAPNRKIDRLGYTRAEGEAELLRYFREDDMPNREELQEWVRTTPIRVRAGTKDELKDKPLQDVLLDLEQTQERIMDAIREVKTMLGEA